MNDDLNVLLATLPPRIREEVYKLGARPELLEIVMDLGRIPEARFYGEEVLLGNKPITDEDINYVIERIGDFGDDNRAGIERTLHRISAIRNRKGKVIGLTCRVGRAVQGTVELVRDVIEQGRSLLILGRPGVGKTTLLREAARMIADELGKRVVIVDTSNEIAGDGDIPHPGIGRARRMQVKTPSEQHSVMIEAVENHMPQVIIIDEIGTELEAAAARTIAERGVQLVGTAHGNTLDNLLMNPTLSDLVGGIQSVTLSDEEARRRGTQKSVLERKAPPTFDVVVEQQSWQHMIVHEEVANTVDDMLRGQVPVAEERIRDDNNQVTIRKIQVASTVLPSWSSTTYGSAGYGQGTWEQGGGYAGRRGGKVRHAEFSSPYIQPQTEEYEEELSRTGTTDAHPALHTMKIYPFGVNRNRLEQSAKQLRVPVIISKDQNEADAVITLKNYYRKQPEQLQGAESERIPIYILKNNTVSQMQECLAHIFDISRNSMAAVEEDQDVAQEALDETEAAIKKVLDKGVPSVELAPQNSFVRRLQHQLAEKNNLLSRSHGREPYRRVKIYRFHS